MDKVASIETSSVKSGWLRGVAQATPIMMGYIPIGFAYGVLAQQAGLSPLNTILMSLIVYAGSAQLIAVSLFAAGLPALSIVFTTFIVNLRHLLFSAAISPYLKGWRKSELAAFAYELTDESFAVHISNFTQGKVVKTEAFATNLTAQVSWCFGSWLGVVAGQLIADVKPLALDYTLPAMFIALLVMQIKNHTQIVVAVLAGLAAVLLTMLGLDHWSVIVATLFGATMGVVIEQIRKSPSATEHAERTQEETG